MQVLGQQQRVLPSEPYYLGLFTTSKLRSCYRFCRSKRIIFHNYQVALEGKCCNAG